MTTTTTAGVGDRKQSFRFYMVRGLKRSESMLDRMVAMADKAAETVTTQTPKSGRYHHGISDAFSTVHA